jgi:hypothetical protein
MKGKRVMRAMQMFKNIRKVSLSVVLKLMEGMSQTGFNKLEPIGTCKADKTPEGQGIVSPSSVWGSLFEDRKSLPMPNGGNMDKEAFLLRLKAWEDETTDKAKHVTAGQHRFLACVALHIMGMNIKPVFADTSDESETIQFQENVNKTRLNRFTSNDILEYSLNTQEKVSEGWLQSMGVARGTAQKVFAQYRLVQHNIPITTATMFDKEQARALANDLDTSNAEEKEAITKKHVSALTEKQAKAMSRRDMEALRDKAGKAGIATALLDAILANSVAKAELALGI